MTRPKGAFQAKSLGDVTHLIHMSRYLGLACLGLVLMLVATTTLMAVQDRVGDLVQIMGLNQPAAMTGPSSRVVRMPTKSSVANPLASESTN